MSGNLNRVTLLGRMGDNIKLSYYSEGNCVGQFRLATNDEYTNRSTNEKVVTTEWHNIVVRNKQAEIIEKYTQKGDLIYLEGRLKTRSWQADDGTPHYITEVVVTDFHLLPNTRAPKAAENPEPLAADKPNDGLPF